MCLSRIIGVQKNLAWKNSSHLISLENELIEEYTEI